MKSDQIKSGFCYRILYKANSYADIKETYVFAKNFAQAEQVFNAEPKGSIQAVEMVWPASTLKQ